MDARIIGGAECGTAEFPRSFEAKKDCCILQVQDYIRVARWGWWWWWRLIWQKIVFALLVSSHACFENLGLCCYSCRHIHHIRPTSSFRARCVVLADTQRGGMRSKSTVYMENIQRDFSRRPSTLGLDLFGSFSLCSRGVQTFSHPSFIYLFPPTTTLHSIKTKTPQRRLHEVSGGVQDRQPRPPGSGPAVPPRRQGHRSLPVRYHRHRCLRRQALQQEG